MAKIEKLLMTSDRETIIRDIQDKLNVQGFSRSMDKIFELAKITIRQKDKLRRDIQKEITAFNFVVGDFVWE